MLTRPAARRGAGAGLCVLLLALSLACDSSSATPPPLVPTPLPPTLALPSTPAPPTDTAVLPPDTLGPPTDTAVPPTGTPIPPMVPAVPPTNTAIPPTATAVRPTQTLRPPTATAAPPAATNTPRPQVPTPTRQAMETVGPGSTGIPGNLSQVERVPPGKKRIALTFDAGSTRGRVPEILDALRQYDAHITFFITGAWADANPDMVRTIVAAGHEVANHSYSHPSFPKLTDEEMIRELARCEAMMQTVAGVNTRPYWRPPYGDENRHVLEVAAGQGYRSIFWTLDSLDSVGKPKTKDFIVKRVTETAIPLDGAIILQHVAADPSVDALPEILARLYAKDLRVVTITELLAP